MTFTSFEVCYCAGAAEYDNVVKRLTSRDGLELAAKTSHQVAMSIDGFRFLTIKDRKEQPPTLQLIVDDLEDYCASLPAGVEFERVRLAIQVLRYNNTHSRNATRWILDGRTTLC